MSSKFLLIMVAILIIVLFPACTRTVAPASLPSPTLTLAPTFTPILPTFTPIPTSTPTQPAFTPFTAESMVDNLLFRTNPGYLFPASKMLKEGTEIQILGKSPGGDWLHVRSTENEEGWLFTALVVFDRDLSTIPIIPPEGVQVVTGKVLDQDGLPVSGMHFTIIQGTGTQAPRNDAMTDADGNFYLFMPQNASGEWTLAYTAYSCKSNKVDAECNWLHGIGGQPYPEQVTVTLPQIAPLDFTWK